MKATGWQAHTVRGFVSILGSKGGVKIESAKSEAGERTYRITKQPARIRQAGGAGLSVCVCHLAQQVPRWTNLSPPAEL